MHRWLRSGGLLINLQPFGEPLNVEVQLGGDRSPVGKARDCPAKLADMASALRVLDELAVAGLYSLLHKSAWQFETQAVSAADWKEFLEKPNCGGAEVDQESLDRALEHPDGRVVLTEENLALVYEPL